MKETTRKIFHWEKDFSRKMIHIALPIALSSYARSGLSTVEHLLVPSALVKSGLSYADALSLIGVLHSMVLPVLLFPTAIVSSFASLLVPEIAAAKARGEKSSISLLARRAILITVVASIGVAGLLAAISEEIALLLYRSPAAGVYLRLLCPLIPVMYLDSIVDAFLKGMGYQVYSMGVNIADAAISILFIPILLPRFGADGYLMVLYLTEIFNFILSIFRLLLHLSFPYPIFGGLFLPLCGSLFGFRLSVRIFGHTDGWRALVLKILFVVSFYWLCFLLFRAFRIKNEKNRSAVLTEGEFCGTIKGKLYENGR